MNTNGSALLSREINRIITDVGSTLGTNFKPKFSTIVKNLFAQGEEGFFYDPKDTETLFQHATENQPVTAAGQTIGLMLDKSKGLVLGEEILTNGDFSSGLVDGDAQTNWNEALLELGLTRFTEGGEA